MKRQPVITGLGIVSPIGIGIDKFWEAALAGRSGIGRPTLFDGSKLPANSRLAGEVRDFNPRLWMTAQTAKVAGRFSQFAVAAAQMAMHDSRMSLTPDTAERCMVSVGSSMSGLADVEQPAFRSFLQGEDMRPWTVLEYPAHAATSHVAIEIGSRGRTASPATACVAGIDAIATSAESVARGQAPVVVAGASETPFSPACVEAFRALGALATWPGRPEEASRPFDKLRRGLGLGEGAAIVVIEDEAAAHARGAMQVVTSCLAIRDSIAPPTINYSVRDPACDLDYVPNVARRVRIRNVLVHAQSIGGSHAALILGAPC